MNSCLYDDGTDAEYWEWYASVHGKNVKPKENEEIDDQDS